MNIELCESLRKTAQNIVEIAESLRGNVSDDICESLLIILHNEYDKLEELMLEF